MLNAECLPFNSIFGLHVWLTRSSEKPRAESREEAWRGFNDGSMSVHLPLEAGARKFSLQSAVGWKPGKRLSQRERKRARHKERQGRVEKKLIFKKFHFRMKRNNQ